MSTTAARSSYPAASQSHDGNADSPETSPIRWLETLNRSDIEIAGGKGANLGEMVRAGMPAPPGFVVTADAWRRFLDAGDLRESIDAAMSSIRPNDFHSLESASLMIQRAIRSLPLASGTARAIAAAYRELSERVGAAEAAVAVRSSATMEDSSETSFAGINRSFLGVRGEADLIDRVREVWASLYSPRVMFYRDHIGASDQPGIAVIVQAMVDAAAAGVAFSLDPATGDRSVIVIDAAFGLGEVVVSGEVEPDHYVVSRQTNDVQNARIGYQRFKLASTGGGSERVTLPPREADRRVLCDGQILEVADLVKRAERLFDGPQDTEWAFAGDRLYLLQSRPITAASDSRTASSPEPSPSPAPGSVLCHGAGMSPGIVSGPVRIAANPAEAANLVPGEILVTDATSPEWTPVLKRAAAVVTVHGGSASHAAIVSRELGLPCIVGAHAALATLNPGMVVTVDGASGTVTFGHAKQMLAESAGSRSMERSSPVTATRIMVNLADPDFAASIAALDIDGVGLLRGEFMMRSALDGVHPGRLIAEKRSDEFVDRMARAMRAFAAAFAPRPVMYRASDLRSNEFRRLAGGELLEREEQNPMIGVRGAFRCSLDPVLFRLELAALRTVSESFSNLHLMLPFVRSPRDLRGCLQVITDSGLMDRRDFQLWIMAEVPSVAYYLPDYAALGVHGVSIGSNDLTQLMLGIDRDNDALAPLYDERDPAVLAEIGRIVEGCRNLGLETSICGQAPSVHPEYADFLIGLGIDSISVSPDAVASTRRLAAAAERRLLLDQCRATRERTAGNAFTRNSLDSRAAEANGTVAPGR